jgi:hypothetical protein
VGGYAAQRAYFAIGEPDPRSVGPSLHTAYFWRVMVSLWWGGMAALAGWRWPGLAGPVSRALPWVVAAAVAVGGLVP